MDKRNRQQPARRAALSIRDLHVYYGQSHAVQGVDMTLEDGVHAVVGRNGMGKTTLCNAIMGLQPPRRGSVRLFGEDITGLPPYKIAAKGVGYTPQGRRLWPSLTVDEHLRLSESSGGAWSVDRIYSIFPRLFERKQNGAGQLSGGEQQMLAISRALLQDPSLLVLDEPTEGLAPVIVDQVENLLLELASEQDVAILLIEQNISVATSVASDVAIMVNGRIRQVMPADRLANDRALQESLLGVGRHSHDDVELNEELLVASPIEPTKVEPEVDGPVSDLTEISAREDDGAATGSLVYVPPTRWSSAKWAETAEPNNQTTSTPPAQTNARPFDEKPEPIFAEPLSSLEALMGDEVLVAGTFDTKGKELGFIKDRIVEQGLRVRTVDLSTSGKPSSADVPPHMVATYYRGGPNNVFSGDRGASVRAMSEAFENWIVRQRGIGGIISAGGSGATALASPAMRSLPIGVPKVMISTVASGDVGQYVGPSDIMMMYSVTDVQGLNRISRRVLANGANAISGMVKTRPNAKVDRRAEPDKPGLGLTMFGVTTPAVQQITDLLKSQYDCLVFHATGTGGRSMEKLADSGLLTAAIDITTTEICDMMMGGVFPATEDRFGAFIRTRIPYVGSVGALDMVNFGSPETVPSHYRNRTFVEHNPQVTLMRTTPEENTRMGEWIADRLNQMTGPVRFLIPEGGVSMLDAPGKPFHDPAADEALFRAIRTNFQESSNRRLIVSPHNVNDPAFAALTVSALEEVHPTVRSSQHAAF